MAFTLEHFPSFPYPPSGMQEVEEVERYLTSLYRSMQEFFSVVPRDIKDGISSVELDDLAKTTLADPGADRIVFWDDGADVYTWLVANTGLAISGTNLNLSHLGLEALTDPGADRIFFWDDSETASKWLAPDGTSIEISGTTLQVVGGVGGLYAFTTITGITNDVVADAVDDTLTLASSDAQLTIVGTAATDTITFDLAIGIADTNLLRVDHVSPADNDYAKFTASGLEGRSYSEVLGDLSGNAGATFDWNDQALTSIGATELYGDIYTDRWLTQDTNTFFGVGVAGDGNLAHGGAAEGWYNTFFGHDAGKAITTGSANCFLGGSTGLSNTSGQANTFVGWTAGYSNTIGSLGTFYGYSAGFYNTEGNENVFFGNYAGATVTTGSNNTFIGSQAGRFQNDGTTGLVTPENSVYIGWKAKSGSVPAGGEDAITNEIVIGYDAVGAGPNTVTLGNASIVTTVLKGNVTGANVTTGADPGHTHGSLYYTETEIDTWRSNVTQTEMSYLDGITSDIQTQLDARCLESVLGTSIGAGLLLDGAVLKTDVELQAIAGLTSAADRYIRFTGSGAADLRTYANVLADLSGSAGAAFAWNSQNLTGIGTIASGDITVDGKLVLSAGSITDGDGAISFGNENLTTTGAVSVGHGLVLTGALLAGGASRGVHDFASGGIRLFSYGADVDTKGTVTYYQKSSDESLTNTPFLIQEDGDILLATTAGNVLIGGATAGTNATKTLAFGSGVAPTTSVANMFQMYSADVSGAAGKAGVHFRDEAGNVTSIGDGKILDSSGAISFGDENLSTTGTLGLGTATPGMELHILTGTREVRIGGTYGGAAWGGTRAAINIDDGTIEGYWQHITNMLIGSRSAHALCFASADARRMWISSTGNFCFGAEAVIGTNGVKVLGVSTGTAPTTSPANAFQMYSADQVAGNACLHTRTEGGAVVKLYQQAHIADAPGDTTANNATTINAILVALENAGLLATS